MNQSVLVTQPWYRPTGEAGGAPVPAKRLIPKEGTDVDGHSPNKDTQDSLASCFLLLSLFSQNCPQHTL